MAETINASVPSIPRRCARQTFRSNVPALIPEDYYRRDLAVPFLDEMIANINSRFSKIQKKAMMAQSLVPSVLMSPGHEQSMTDLAHQLAEFYADDLPNPSTLQLELHVWKCKWKSFSAERPSSLSKSLFHANETMFPNIRQLLRIVSTLPVTSCEFERSISVLRRLKTCTCVQQWRRD